MAQGRMVELTRLFAGAGLPVPCSPSPADFHAPPVIHFRALASYDWGHFARYDWGLSASWLIYHHIDGVMGAWALG